MTLSSLTRTCALLALLWIAAPASAQNFDAAAKTARADLEKALAELAALQQKIAEEKLPLAKRLRELEEQVLSKRREFDRIQKLRGAKAFDLETLRAEAKARRDENTYITSLLDEYIRAFESRLHISELQRYHPTIQESKLAIEDVNISPAVRFNRQISVARASLARLENIIGGDSFAGRALTAKGTMEKGKFALLGPVVVFASDESDTVGISELVLGTLEPSVLDIGRQFHTGIRELLRNGAGELPVDPSLGSAIKIAGTRETLFQHIRKGGPVMVPIIGLAIAAAAVSVIKWAQLRGMQRPGPEQLQLILNRVLDGDLRGAMEHATAVKGAAGEMLAAAVQHAHERKEILEEVMYEKLLSTKPKLERMLAFIAVTAATEPMLGLLGTVTGIIRTFKLITVFGTGDPKLLSSGISEALITTEFGLLFAIPGLLVHALLSRKVRGLLASMEQAAVAFINGLTEPRQTTTRSR